MIENGKVVSVHYTGKLTTGEVFDSSEGRDPLTFQVGSGQIIPGFEKAILGKNIGEDVVVTIPSSQAYGSIREDLFIKVPKENMPGEVEIGQSLSAQADNGQTVNVVVHEINEDHIVINGNHPLAGEDLEFSISIVEIK
jgi:FKBP-type peptidyl-prolyl cis-trans isomerase 2